MMDFSSNCLGRLSQREFCLWESPHFKSFFQIWRRIWFFLKVSKTQSNYKLRFPPQLRRTKKNFFCFWLFLTKILVTGRPNLPSFSHQYFRQLLFLTFPPYLPKLCFLFYISFFDVIYQRRRDRVVVRAVDGKIKIPGSSLAADKFFFPVFSIFKKKLRICGRRTFC